MYKCQLVGPNGQTRPLETQVLGDTTLSVAAGMVAQEIGDRTHPDEVYFFGVQSRSLSPERLHYICAQNTTNSGTADRLASYLTNIVGLEPPKTLKAQGTYTYTDLIELGIDGEYELREPLSIAANAETQYPVPANPFDWVSADPTISENAEAMISYRGNAVIFDTPLARPILFCCLAKDVLASTADRAIQTNLARVYFPQMAARGVLTPAGLRALHADAATPPPPPSQDTALAVLGLHEGLQDSGIGATELTAVFHPNLPVNVPLELLFRSIPASKDLPFIKFNMGRGRSRLYRLYAPPGPDGSKRPKLGRLRIARLQTAVAMQEGIGYAVLGGDALCTLDVTPTGNLRLRFIAQAPVSFDRLAERLNSMMGTALTQLNAVLSDTGFQYPTKFELDAEGTEVQNIVLRGVRKDVERFEPEKVVTCMSDVMYTTDVEDSLVELVYHRVGYYDNLSAVEKYITTRLRQSRGVSEVVRGVERGFGMTNAEAVGAVATWAQKTQDELNAHANQRLRIVTSGGVDVALTRTRADRSAAISAEGIIGLGQARLLAKYMAVVLASSCSPAAAERFTVALGACAPPSAEEAAAGRAAAAPGTPSGPELEPAGKAVPVTIQDNRIIADEDDDDAMDDLLDLYGDDVMDEVVGQDELSMLLADDDNDGAAGEGGEAGADTRESDDVSSSATPGPGASAAAAAAPAAPAPTPVAAPPPAPRGADVVGMRLSGPNYFLRRLYDRDPKLFLATKVGKFETYSRMCPHNVRRQPVVLTQAEKERMEREAPDSFDGSDQALIRYGSGERPPNWYMCPRYWCLKTDLPMTDAQVKAGECGGKIIPMDAKEVPDDAFIFEFDAGDRNSEHRDNEGRYIQHYPGFIDPDRHPDGLCIPCCFKNPNQKKLRARIAACTSSADGDGKVAIRKEEKRTSRLYVKDANKYPLPAGDIGFLPPIVQKLLGTDNSKCTVSQRDKTIATNVRCVLRGGVGGRLEGRSFLNAVAVAAGKSTQEMVTRLAEAVTPETIGQFQQGTLVASLTPRLGDLRERDARLGPAQLREIAANRLRGMIRDPDATVGYQYLWDLARLRAFAQPVNLIVLLLDEEDGSDNAKLLCPAAISGQPNHDPARGTLVLLRKNGYYEPVMVYRSSAAGGEAPLAPIERVLGMPGTKEPEVKAAVDHLGEIANGCGGRAVRAEPVPTRQQVENALATRGGKVVSFVVSFGGRLVALWVALGDGTRVVVPIEATAIPEGNVHLELVGGADTLQGVDETLVAMRRFSDETGLRLAGDSIVVEDGRAVAILTKSDRVVPTVPSSLAGQEAGQYKGLELVDVPSDSGPLAADAASVLGTGQDEARLAAAAAIKAHSETYELFRAWLRAKLLDPAMANMRRQVTKAAGQKAPVGRRMEAVMKALNRGLEGRLEVRSARGALGIDTGAATVPVISGDGAIFYLPEGLFTIPDILWRASDELVRYPNAASFILGRSLFYSSQPGEYSLRPDEIIMPETMLAQQVEDMTSSGLMMGVVGPSAALSSVTEPGDDPIVEVAGAAVVPPGEVQQSPRDAAAAAGPTPAASAAAHASPSPRTKASTPQRSTPSGCPQPERRQVNAHDKLRKNNLVPSGTVMVKPEEQIQCIWDLLAMGVSELTENTITATDLRLVVSRAYRLLPSEQAAQAAETWRAEGKVGFVKQLAGPSGPVLAGLVSRPEYYPTNIDLFYIGKVYGLTVVIVSSVKTKQTGTEFITYGPADSGDTEPKLLFLKRGKQHHNRPMMYSAIASPGGLLMRTILPSLQTAIDANRLASPFHQVVRKVVVRRE